MRINYGFVLVGALIVLNVLIGVSLRGAYDKADGNNKRLEQQSTILQHESQLLDQAISNRERSLKVSCEIRRVTYSNELYYHKELSVINSKFANEKYYDKVDSSFLKDRAEQWNARKKLEDEFITAYRFDWPSTCGSVPSVPTAYQYPKKM